MKKLLLLLLPFYSMAQTFPYDEGFHGIVSGTLPAGWQGDMKVQADHGLNDFKGMAADLSSVDMVDSAITPWIGPLDANTEFYFWYRIVDQFIYPSTEKHLMDDGKLVISYSTDSINYFPYYTIDSGNHTASLAYRRIVFPVTTLGGQTVKFKFWCNFDGGSSYFIDIDSIKVRPFTTLLSVNNMADNSLTLFPNPVKSGDVLWLQFGEGVEQNITVYDVTGKILAFHPSSVIGQPSNTRFSLSTSHLSPGIYFIRYGTHTRKLVVQ